MSKELLIKDAIIKVVAKEDLSFEEAYGVMNEIMSGKTSQTQNAAFLAALSTKSAKMETIDEITGCAKAMREHATAVDLGVPTLDIVGTGGDNAQSFNISTTAMFVLAAGGVKVAKHGNRAASSKSGTADCLQALGVNLDHGPEDLRTMINEVGACFIFAQKYHSSMKHVGAIRKELGFRTVFNILGPLTNPAHPEMVAIGVYDEALVEPIAHVLRHLGVQRGLIMYGMDKLDEISLSAPTKVCDFDGDNYRTYMIQPEDFGFERAPKDAQQGGTPEENAEITKSILKGEKGPRRNIVVLNAGAGLYVGGKADTLEGGVRLAEELIDSGAAYATLEKMIEVSNR